ncbi:MAG: hypothetical protein QGG62_06910 [Candidatus Poseidoniaceae archaeon]|jgi:predicted RNA binding protein with dsRBD fold (UPF0201 family)|nr:hypothetical protein [Candidatus Poseidoniaceae archaeon]
MDLKPLAYNGRDEGIEISLRTELRPGDDVKNVVTAIHSLFPDAIVEEFEAETFPSKQLAEIVCDHLSFEVFLEILRKQAILDTAMDAMGQNMQENQTIFRISRLAAFAGKIAFVFDDMPLGGCFEIHLKGVGLSDWIEACTWHSGRQHIPRQLHDEAAMDTTGEASTWHQ